LFVEGILTPKLQKNHLIFDPKTGEQNL